MIDSVALSALNVLIVPVVLYSLAGWCGRVGGHCTPNNLYKPPRRVHRYALYSPRRSWNYTNRKRRYGCGS